MEIGHIRELPTQRKLSLDGVLRVVEAPKYREHYLFVGEYKIATLTKTSIDEYLVLVYTPNKDEPNFLELNRLAEEFMDKIGIKSYLAVKAPSERPRAVYSSDQKGDSLAGAR